MTKTTLAILGLLALTGATAATSASPWQMLAQAIATEYSTVVDVHLGENRATWPASLPRPNLEPIGFVVTHDGLMRSYFQAADAEAALEAYGKSLPAHGWRTLNPVMGTVGFASIQAEPRHAVYCSSTGDQAELGAAPGLVSVWFAPQSQECHAFQRAPMQISQLAPVWPTPPVPNFKAHKGDQLHDLGSDSNGLGEMGQRLAFQSPRTPAEIWADFAKQLRAAGWAQNAASANKTFAAGVFSLTDKHGAFWQATLSVLHRAGHAYGRITLDVKNLTATV
jgi:hypothetical protein